MTIEYKNKQLERATIFVKAATSAMVVATFVMLFGFDEPLVPVGNLYKIQVAMLCIFLVGKIVRLLNARSVKQFVVANWFEIPLLAALVAIMIDPDFWFSDFAPGSVRHVAVGTYLLVEVFLKVFSNSVKLIIMGRNPTRTLIITFVVLIVIGAALLMLPRSLADGAPPLRFIDALFTTTSAVTTTGLIVVDTGSVYSTFGQMIILILFQIGGLGYMILISSIVLFRRRRLSLDERVHLNGSVIRPEKVEILRYVRSIIVFSFVFELLGTLALGYQWQRYFPYSKAMYVGFFHAVSAFCTAGFSLFSDSLTQYRHSTLFNLVVGMICVTGGIGFFVLYDVSNFFVKTIRRKHPRRLSAHTKLALFVTFSLFLVGSILIFFCENTDSTPGLGGRALNAGFQAVSSSTTTGFNTVDVAKMSKTSLFGIILLMFIGASPGGTGGGIKSTTFGLIVLSLYALLTGREDVNVFRGRVPPETIRKAFGVALAGVLCLSAAILVLTATEDAPFLDIFFEATSALGTVGLSTGITSQLTSAGKIIIVITMLIGRIGPLAVGFSLIGKPKKANFQYVDEDILVG